MASLTNAYNQEDEEAGEVLPDVAALDARIAAAEESLRKASSAADKRNALETRRAGLRKRQCCPERLCPMTTL
jgi:hypothetical protein